MPLLTVADSPPDWFVQSFALFEFGFNYLLENMPAVVFGQVFTVVCTTYLLMKEPPSELHATLQHMPSLKTRHWRRLFRRALVVLQSDEPHWVRLRAAAFLLNAMWLLPDELDGKTRADALGAVKEILLEQPQNALTSGLRRQLGELQAITPPS